MFIFSYKILINDYGCRKVSTTLAPDILDIKNNFYICLWLQSYLEYQNCLVRVLSNKLNILLNSYV